MKTLTTTTTFLNIKIKTIKIVFSAISHCDYYAVFLMIILFCYYLGKQNS